MKRVKQIAILLTLMSCQGINNKLSNGSWIITKGIYKDQEIAFESKDIVQFADRYGNVKVTLTFFQGGRIIIPGIESSDICGKWKIVNNQLNIEIDSAKYNFLYNQDKDRRDLNKLLRSDSLETSSISEPDSNRILNNPLETIEFEGAFKIYREPFDVKFTGDNLILTSETTTIVARKDRSMDGLFKGL